MGTIHPAASTSVPQPSRTCARLDSRPHHQPAVPNEPSVLVFIKTAVFEPSNEPSETPTNPSRNPTCLTICPHHSACRLPRCVTLLGDVPNPALMALALWLGDKFIKLSDAAPCRKTVLASTLGSCSIPRVPRSSNIHLRVTDSCKFAC